MTEPLRRCPCGKVPDSLSAVLADSIFWARAYCNRCNVWSVEFRTLRNAYMSEEFKERMREAWNNAPRGGEPEELKRRCAEQADTIKRLQASLDETWATIRKHKKARDENPA